MCGNRNFRYSVSIHDPGRDFECLLADFTFYEKWIEFKRGHCFLRQLSGTGKHAFTNKLVGLRHFKFV